MTVPPRPARASAGAHGGEFVEREERFGPYLKNRTTRMIR